MTVELQAARERIRLKNQRLAHVHVTASELLDGVGALTAQRLQGISDLVERLRDTASVECSHASTIVGLLLEDIDELQATLDQLLDLGRARLGVLSLWRTRHDLAAGLRPPIEAFQTQSELRGINFQYDLPYDLPLVYCDREKLRQAIGSLVANAFFFVGRGGSVRLWARSTEDRKRVLLGIGDNAPGIDQEELNQIWQAAEHVRLATEPAPNAFGFALRAAREIIERNLGHLHVMSGADGSELVMSLPTDDPATLLASRLDSIARQGGHSFEVCLLAANTLSIEGAALADEFLQRSLRGGDLVCRVTENSWRLAVNCPVDDLPDLLARLHGAWTHARSNPAFHSLAPLQLETLGAWDGKRQREELIVAFSHACASQSSHQGDLRMLLLDTDQEFMQGLSSRLEKAGYDIVGQRPATHVGELIADYPRAVVLDLRTGTGKGFSGASEPSTDEAAAVIMLASHLRGQQYALEREARNFWQPNELAPAR